MSALHRGIQNFYREVSKHFYWKNLFADVTKFVQACVICCTLRHSTQAPRGALSSLPSTHAKLGAWSIDQITNLPMSKQGHDRLCVATERTTRFKVLIPGHSQDNAETAATGFFYNIVCRFGLPDTIFMDQDTLYRSKFWISLFKLWNTSQNFSTAHHKTFNGLSERAILDTELTLRYILSNSDSDMDCWEDFIPMVAFILNDTHHTALTPPGQSSLSVTPFLAMLGVNPRKPENWTSLTQNTTSSAGSNVHNWSNHLGDLFQLCKDSSREASIDSLSILNKRRSIETFQEGDSVYMNTKHLNKKHLDYAATQLTQPYFGPFPIVQKLSNTVYRLDLSSKPKLKICPDIHIMYLKKKQDLASEDTTMQEFLAEPRTINKIASANQPEETVIMNPDEAVLLLQKIQDLSLQDPKLDTKPVDAPRLIVSKSLRNKRSITNPNLPVTATTANIIQSPSPLSSVSTPKLPPPGNSTSSDTNLPVTTTTANIIQSPSPLSSVPTPELPHPGETTSSDHTSTPVTFIQERIERKLDTSDSIISKEQLPEDISKTSNIQRETKPKELNSRLDNTNANWIQKSGRISKQPMKYGQGN